MRGLATLAAIATAFIASEAQAYTFLQRLGCPGDMGAAWPARLLPSPWHLQEGGYPPLSLGEVHEVLERSIDVWTQPCCSGFSHEFQGLITSNGIGIAEENVITFATRNWPDWLGNSNSVIAVTLPGIQRATCELTDSDMVFNGLGFVFTTDGVLEGRGEVDFETIAVHEFGHWVGLDHSRNPNVRGGYEPESVMFPSYRGGIGDRALYLDDMLAVCALYPSPCGDCSTDRDCPEGTRCQEDGSCVRAACREHRDCPPESICGDGQCWRGCRYNVECQEGELCRSGACVTDAPCTTCDRCRRHRDCGDSPDDYCLELDDSGRKCTNVCESDADCAGDSICWDVQGAGVKLCGAPTPDTALCPDDFTCISQTCGSLGAACGSCGSDADTCVLTDYGSTCSCTCRTDADCGHGTCLEDPITGIPSCYLPADTVACGDTRCAPGSACVDGTCLNRCGGDVCGAQEICDDGTCVSPCQGCLPGETCDPASRACVGGEECGDVTCVAGEACVAGVCGVPCGGTICGDGERCAQGACVKAQTSEAKKSGGGCAAAGASSSLWGLVALGSLLLRRGRADSGREA